MRSISGTRKGFDFLAFGSFDYIDVILKQNLGRGWSTAANLRFGILVFHWAGSGPNF